MCVVKTMEYVVSSEDLQDLIASRITVKCVPFTEEEIFCETQSLLIGSKFENDNTKTKHFIKKIIRVLLNNNFIIKEVNRYRIST